MHKESPWNKELAYLFGLLLGDGSLPISKTKRENGRLQNRYFIYFWSNNKEFLEDLYVPIFKKLFLLEPRIERLNHKINDFYNCRIESKHIYLYLASLGFTLGRKARIAKVPNLPSEFRYDLLAGLLDTDGGKKGSGFGLSTASEELAIFCSDLFRELDLPFHSCPWKYKGHMYHQIYVRRKGFLKLLEHIPIRNKEKINFLKTKAL